MDHSQRQLHAVVVPICVAVLCLFGCAKEPATSMAVAPGGVGASGAGIGADGSGQGDAAGSARAGAGDMAGGEGRSGADSGQGVGGRGGGDGSDWRSGGAHREADGAGGRGSGRDGAGGSAGGAGGSTGGGTDGSGVGPGAAGAAGGGGVGGAGGGQGVSGAMRPEPKEFAAVPELWDIHFDFDRYDIRPDAANVLNANAEWLRAHPSAAILIEGHCDDRGTNEYNLALGHHRAESAMNYLVAQGVPASRITVISYGEERPLCTDDTEACWAKNRRAHTLVRRR
jgi:peptidoglycan-associated lipoprotein